MKKMLHWFKKTIKTDSTGFTLIEMAVVLVIVGIVISIVATVLPSLIKSSKVKKARAILEQVDYAIQGYVAANGRLPFADKGTSGKEDSLTPTYFGNLPAPGRRRPWRRWTWSRSACRRTRAGTA